MRSWRPSAGRGKDAGSLPAYAVVDPELLVLGGPVGRHPWLLTRLELAARTLQPLPVHLVSGALDGSAAVRGALLRGLAEGQQALLRSGD